MTLVDAILIIAITLIVGSLAYLFVARHSPEGGRGDRTPTNVYLVTGGAMSLLIAFTLSLTFSQYSTAQQAAQQEADAVMSMSRAATFMPTSIGEPLQNQLVCYAQNTINIEWPRMRQGKTDLSPEVRKNLDQMTAILSVNANAAGQGLGIWEAADQQRLAAHEQLLVIAGSTVPPILWILLITGSIITIGSLFVYADRSKPAWGHILVVIGPLFIASAALIVIAFFDHPYAGTPGSVTPHAMQVILYNMTHDKVGNFPLPHCPTSS